MRQIGRTWTVPNAGQHAIMIVNVGSVPGCTQGTPVMDIDAFTVDIISFNTASYIVNGFNDTDSAIRFSPQGGNPGEWQVSSGIPISYMNDAHLSYTKDSFFRQTTVGQSIGYIYSKDNSSGMIDITIDGELRATLDQYWPYPIRQRIWKFNTPTIQLPNGVVIDTHVVHGYIRGQKQSSSSNTFADIDRLDIASKVPYPNLFNAVKVGLNTNTGVKAWISTSNPIIRGEQSSNLDWSYSRVYIQKYVTGYPPAFCEIGHIAKSNGYNYV